MPCRDHEPYHVNTVYETPSEGDIAEAVKKKPGNLVPELSVLIQENLKLGSEIERAKDAVHMFYARNDLLARMLCSLMTKLSEGKPFQLGSIEGLEQWWTEHQMFDERRKARGEV